MSRKTQKERWKEETGLPYDERSQVLLLIFSSIASCVHFLFVQPPHRLCLSGDQVQKTTFYCIMTGDRGGSAVTVLFYAQVVVIYTPSPRTMSSMDSHTNLYFISHRERRMVL